ncbi:MAG: GAF domain-containing protein [Brumimicrobium sp.]
MKPITANAFNEEAEIYRRVDPKKALELSRKALELSKDKDDKEEKGKALHNISEAYLWMSDFDLAFDFAYKALSIFKDLNLNSNAGSVHYTLGTIFFYLSDYENALDEFMSSYKCFEMDTNELGIAEAYNGIGSAYYAIDENKKAVQYLTISLNKCKEINAKGLIQKVLDGLGKAYNNLKKYDKSLEILLECVAIINNENGSNHVKAHALNNIGEVYFNKRSYDDALKYFNESLEIRKKSNFIAGQAHCYANIGKTYTKLADFNKALENLEHSLNLSKKSKNKENEAETCRLLSNLYELKSNFKLSLVYFKDYHRLNHEIKNENADRRSKSIQLKFKVEQEEQERLLLKNKNKNLKKYSTDLIKLSEIGKSLTSILSAEKIIEKAYLKVNELMEAPSFGLGIYNPKKNELFFPGYIEDGKVLSDVSFSLEDETRLATICYNSQQEILIHDFDKEYSKWLSNISKPISGKLTDSIIYLPFEIPNGASGVITVQNYRTNSYKDHHVNMLKNLAVYMAIAYQNAKLYSSLEKKVNQRTQEIVSQKEEIESSYRLTALLSEVGRQLTSSTDFQSIFLKLHNNVSELMDASCFGVRLYNPEKNHIEYKFEIEKGIVDEESFFVSMDETDNYSVWCVKNNKTIFINDNQKEYKKYTNKIMVPSGEMPHSLIFYPMTFAGRVIGLITVQSFKRNAYNQNHIEILKTLASFTAVALENVSLVENLEDKVAERTNEVVKQKEELEKSHQNTQLLNEIGREVTSTLNIEDVLEKVYENINKLMDASIIGIGIHNNDKLEIKGAIENGVKLPDFSYDLSDEGSLAISCFNDKKEIFISNLDKEIGNYVKGNSKTLIGDKPQSILYIPLLAKNKAIGTISVQSFKANAYSDYHINILRNLALYTATAIENASLYTDMENKVLERTKEVVLQKEEIEKTYNNTKIVGQIGQDIISTHDLEGIFDKMHSNVNELMDATIFSIRICDYEKHEIDYRYTIESGERLGQMSISMDDYDNYSVWCLRNKKDIFINDHPKDYKKYTKKIVVVGGELPESLIFCPMMIGNRVIGIISAQSFKKNAYKEYHLDILRTLAAYSAIAFENANLIKNMENQVLVRTAEVVKQKEIIEEKNKDITDSILYAQRIQNVILPPIDEFQDNFVKSFVVFKPRDIVSGDFYWIEEVEDKIYLAVVDCTGHGVPGALVSVVGANGLNRCLLEFNLRKPSDILNKLSQLVTETFEKTDSNVRDGMDIALCCIDKNTHELSFSGAYNPLWIIREDYNVTDDIESYKLLTEGSKTLIEIKSDKQPIGYSYEPKPFTTVNFSLKKNDVVYLFSDGFADQFGGHEEDVIRKGGKKFKSINFKKLLLSLSHKPLEEQGDIIEETFETWRGELEQVDDVCVLGVKLP